MMSTGEMGFHISICHGTLVQGSTIFYVVCDQLSFTS